MEKYNGLQVGDKVQIGNISATVIRLVEWDDTLIEVRTPGGTKCVDSTTATRI